MTWDLVWGDREEGLLNVEKQTGKTPISLLNKPKLHPWLAWYYEAFWLIDSGRPIYQGSIGRVPLSEMTAYFAIFDVSEIEAKQLFIKTMRALDSIYVKHINEAIKRKIASEKADAERAAERGRR